MQKWKRAKQEKIASQDESNKSKTTSAEYKRRQRERERESKRAAAQASSVDSVAVERRDVSPQPSTSTHTVNPGTVQHQTGQDGRQVPVVPMKIEQRVNTIDTSQPETAQISRTSFKPLTKRSSEQRAALSTSSEPGPSRLKTRRAVAVEQARQEEESMSI
jgi:hypothetical protein